MSKQFGSTIALDHLDLAVPTGSVFGFLGPNGAGKTTTIRMLMGLARPSTGYATVLGLDATRDRDEVHRRVGYLPGDFTAYADLTGGEYLDYLGRLRADADPRRREELVDRLELDVSRTIRTLSRGNRQKVGLVQAFMHNPDLLVLDEPTSGLDPLMQRQFREIASAARAAGSTVFLSSHVLGEVEEIADTVAIVKEGRLVVVDALEHLKERARRHIELTFRDPPPASTFDSIPGVRDVTVLDHTIRLVIEGSMEAVFRAAAPLGVENVVADHAPLDEILIGYYESDSS
ncbi:MAG: ABC transporter ATP-binding protein [Acidimicrobiia bacterium]|nr:ABC transporter ATP-binding protein [Acidimicrobiia bacterium]